MYKVMLTKAEINCLLDALYLLEREREELSYCGRISPLPELHTVKDNLNAALKRTDNGQS